MGAERLGWAVAASRRVRVLVAAWVPACAGMTEGRRNDGGGLARAGVGGVKWLGCCARRDTRGERGYDGEVGRGYDGEVGRGCDGGGGAGMTEVGARV